ncbi:TetR/AcrR family transcriptional regulator [Kordiimonas aestuarii]|uniref:TetR/AcrR family transcriptional regulator n=1 Tax=Kordiimonas aestuarii TaxID=1005925 RepID=UPI0021CE14E8|nr:TetR/AcrR family transcriptional regulator [Kordiimonas aestuarii]
MSTREKKRRGAGRPKDNNEDRRARLIDVAGPVFSQQGYAATKIPALAKAADVTPAMVHYYFGGKDGLLEAVFNGAFKPLLDKLDEPSTLEEWAITFHDHLLERRWMPHLMIREVIMESGHLRDHFAAEFAPRILAKWLTLFANEKAEGRMREDADDLRHVVLIMGMLVYPFVVAPLSGILTDSPFGDDQMRQFRDDAVRLFFRGAKG